MSKSAKPVRIGLISGSTREGSINKQLVRAVSLIFKDMGAKPVKISLKDYQMPIYDGDWEAKNGVPPTVKKLIRRIKSCDGVFISTPEYNGSLPALLKNTIDWTTRVELGHFKGPIYGIGAASPGPMAGIMAMRELQFILTRLGANVIPTQVGAGNAGQAFDKKGRLVEGFSKNQAQHMASQMLTQIKQKR
ncbi:MAG: NAD(P)H-dependent oxidoreductase [Acidimicrobiales bacterium]|nr:NAD(P)H-dependent oxidoreductase [Hyphomonadaceae bacterium]RZV41548.1 MAG: NAD(P)H-dependent oxidoreductase [Acidimicrobiales bacterium]